MKLPNELTQAQYEHYLGLMNTLCGYKEFCDFLETEEYHHFMDFEEKHCDDVFYLEDYDCVQFANGCTRFVIWTDDCDLVLKINMGSRCHNINYNKSEAEFYQLAKLAGVESGFAWTYKFFDYTLPSGKTIEVYASQFCDCNADALSDESYSANYEKWCNEKGYNSDEDHYEEFQDKADYEDSYGMLVYAGSVWGNEFAQRVADFCDDNRINDLHAGNWGFAGNVPVITDYAGYGSPENRGHINLDLI